MPSALCSSWAACSASTGCLIRPGLSPLPAAACSFRAAASALPCALCAVWRPLWSQQSTQGFACHTMRSNSEEVVCREGERNPKWGVERTPEAHSCHPIVQWLFQVYNGMKSNSIGAHKVVSCLLVTILFAGHHLVCWSPSCLCQSRAQGTILEFLRPHALALPDNSSISIDRG